MILVTGATGMVGGNLIWFLLQENSSIKALRRNSSNLEPLKSIFKFYTNEPDTYLERIDWIIGDVQDEIFLNRAFKDITVIYHCAAIVSLGDSSNNMLDVNVIGTRNVVNACLNNKISKLCFVSSIAACGSSNKGEIITEDTKWIDKSNRSLYSKSKYYSEQEVWKGIKNGLNAVIVNPGVILGVSGTATGSSELFLRTKKGLPFYTNGGSGYIDVRDVVNTMIRLINADINSERFILIADNFSNKDILSWMSEGFGKRKPFIYIGKKMMFTIGFIAEIYAKLFKIKLTIDRKTAHTASNREYYSNEKVSNQLGLRFTPIKESIFEICNYIQNN